MTEIGQFAVAGRRYFCKLCGCLVHSLYLKQHAERCRP